MLITRTSIVSGITRTMDLPVTSTQMKALDDGARIEDIMPDLTPMEREFILSGLTPDEWHASIKVEGPDLPQNDNQEDDDFTFEEYQDEQTREPRTEGPDSTAQHDSTQPFEHLAYQQCTARICERDRNFVLGPSHTVHSSDVVSDHATTHGAADTPPPPPAKNQSSPDRLKQPPTRPHPAGRDQQDRLPDIE